MVYYCMVASTFALLFGLVAFWRTRPKRGRREDTTSLKRLQTTRADQTSSPCNGAYEMLDQSGLELPENQIYQNLDNQRIQEPSLDLQQGPSTSSQGTVRPKYDQKISKDMRSSDQQDDQSAFYHVIDIL